MTSAPDLDGFLAELDLRQQRLLGLIGPSVEHAHLLAEVEGLSEQLLVAKEELRVQHEELERTRGAVLALRRDRERLMMNSDGAYVTTDRNGMVMAVSQGLARLIDPSPVNLASRPIATWFEVPARRVVRSLINRAMATAEPQHAAGLAVAIGQQRLPVEVVVERVTSPTGLETWLRWELVPVEQAAASRPPVSDYGALALSLAACKSVDQMYPVIVEAAHRLVPGGIDVGLTALGAGAGATVVASSSAAARQLDEAQLRAQTGPLVDAIAGQLPVHSEDFLVGELACAGALAVPLVSGTRTHGVLTFYPAGGAVPERQVRSAEELASHAAAALTHAAETENLRAAIRTRQMIGEAVGVLMERYRLTPEAAFERLRRRSQDTNLKLRDIAQQVAETGLSPTEIGGP